MKKIVLMAACACAGVAMEVHGEIYGDVPDSRHAWAVHDWNRPKPAKVEPGAYVMTTAPSDAVVLFDGTAGSLAAHWCDAKGAPTQWKLGTEGDFYCVPGWKNGGDIRTRDEFGDCQLHLEYRHEPDVTDGGRGPQMRGNSGVFCMGNYELQVLESYYTSSDLAGKEGFVDNYTDGQAGAIYAENPPQVNPARRPGEWQTYDVVFHQPVWDGERLVHPGSVTVFFNGVLVQDHWEMEGLTTHRVRRPLRPHPPVGPLQLQDHGCTVHFRNIWYRPLPSRWANLTHSAMSADENEVLKLRRETAAKLLAKIPDRGAVTFENVAALAEVVSYANEGEAAEAWKRVTDGFSAMMDGKDGAWFAENKDRLVKLRRQLDMLLRARIISADFGLYSRLLAAELR